MDNLQNGWRFLLDFLPDAVVMHDGNVFVHVNRAACHFFESADPELMIGKPYIERIYPDDRALVITRISAVFHGRPSALREYRIVTLTGTVKDVEAKATRVTYGDKPCNLVILRDITERKRQQDELLALNAKLRHMQEQQRQLSRSLINNGERQSAVLAMELHDRIGQPLSSLKMNLERMLLESPHLDSAERGRMEEFIEALRRSIVDLKQMSTELLPSIIANLGLAHSLNSLRDEVANRIGLDVRVFTNGLARHYGGDIEIAVYRVIQEGLNNVVKHAAASRCFVNLLDNGRALSLTIEDDGRGFDAAARSLTGGGAFSLGLHIMRERVEQLGGDFSIDSAPGRGTIILASIPIAKAVAAPQPAACGREDQKEES